MSALLSILTVLFSLGFLLLIGRKSIWLGFLIPSLFMGFILLSPSAMKKVVISTFCDPSILLLALAVGIIPLIGGVLEEGGLLEEFTRQIRIKRRLFVALAPALLGSLPMPGGAILSAPLVGRGLEGRPGPEKAAVNVWFRHVLVLIYPLGTLLATTKMAHVSLYGAMLATIPFFAVMVIAGHLTLLRKIPGTMPGDQPFSRITLLKVLGVIFSAPIIHLTLSLLFPRVMGEIHLLIGVTAALAAALYYSPIPKGEWRSFLARIHPHRYTLLILGVFLFMYTFQATGITRLVASLPLSKTALFVGVGALLGFLTGRVNLPVALLVPLAAAHPDWPAMGCVDFAIMHFAIFTGYLISPVHPCILVSLEYFDTDYLKTLARFAAPTIITFLTIFFTGLTWWGG